jgi:hypothetical protein
MSTTLLRARQMSLALLVIAVVDHGNLTIECSGSRPNSSGLLRMGRDLMRRSGWGDMVNASANVQVTLSRSDLSRLPNDGVAYPADDCIGAARACSGRFHREER